MSYLDPYTGEWTAAKARHLLKRTSFGITQDLVAEAVGLGLSNTIEKLFEDQSLPEPPLKYEPDGTGKGEINDPHAKQGETWVTAPLHPDLPISQDNSRVFRARNRSLYTWTFLQMQDAGISIREKLTLFWHNHFVAVNTYPHREYYYATILRKNALGNFKEMTKQITIDPNMLLYLSGNQNSNTAPNENYSRELLELFTIGKGVAVGNGDYTNYTEEDVVQIAKVLTGWRVRGLKHEDTLNAYFTNSRHTKGSKTLSHRFNKAVISENGANEYKDIIEVIFQQDECSRFIMRKLYRWFVKETISDDVETNVIEPLAKIMRDHHYDIAPALRVLFASNHFFENTFCMVKSPIDLMLSTTKALLYVAPTSSLKETYDFAYLLYLASTDIEQSIFHHPDVAGWKAYYQEPLFYKTWVNSYTLPKRLEFCKNLIIGGKLTIGKKKYTVPPLIPVLLVVAKIENATDPNLLIKELANHLFNYEISQSHIEKLKEFLIQGLPDFEWTVEYSTYLANPSDIGLQSSVESKLRNLIGTMVQMPEFQIM